MTRRVSPTRRGLAVLVLVVVATAMSWRFTPRALNAVAVPAALGLLVGVLAVALPPAPTIELSTARPGFPGEERALTVTVRGRGLATLTLDLPAVLERDAVTVTRTLPETWTESLTLVGRGVEDVEVDAVCLRDPLGLFERRVSSDATAELVGYPRYHHLTEELSALLARTDSTAERTTFDRVRQYQPGDPLRRVAWKQSAKHQDLYVVDHAATARPGPIELVGGGPYSAADDLATGLASIADAALRSGLAVGLTLPDHRVPPGQGSDHRRELFEVLARTAGGSVPETDAAEPLTVEPASPTATGSQTGLVLRGTGEQRSLESLLGAARHDADLGPANRAVVPATDRGAGNQTRGDRGPQTARAGPASHTLSGEPQ